MKQKDYSEIEEKLSRKAEKLEADINYSGAMRDSKTKEGIKREKKEKRSFDFPGRQLVAAALAMVIVGAGTFGALKFLEYKGAQRLAEQGSEGTSDGEKLAEADVNEVNPEKDLVIEPVEYDPRNDYGSGYVYVTSGDKVYQPFICEQKRMAVIDYEPPKFEYSGKLNIVNNVKDREWTVLTANFWFPGKESYDVTFDGMDLKMICSWIDGHKSGTYRVTFKVTWDDPDDENAKIYYVDFYVEKSTESAVFEDVVRFDIDYTDNGDELKLDLPLDHYFSHVYEVNCDAAKALGYDIFWYDAAPIEVSSIEMGVCILDEKGNLVFDYQMTDYANTILSEIWYARQTPSDHPMMFFLTSQLISSNGWVYSNLYAFDVTTKEEYLVISVGPEPHHSQSNLQVYGALSYENERMIVHYYDDLPRNIMNPYDKETWPDDPFAELPIKWNGSKYVVEGIDSVRYPIENYGADTGTDVYVDPVTDTQDHSAWPYDPTGWVLVKSGSNQCAPAVTGYYKGSVRESYNIDIPVLEYGENSTIEILNNVRTTWHLADVGIDGKPIQNLANFGEYLKTLPINPEI